MKSTTKRTWRIPKDVHEIKVVYTRPIIDGKMQITQSSDAYDLIKEFIDTERIDYKEFFFVVLLNRRGYVLGIACISEGTTTQVTVSIKEAVQLALTTNASTIIIAHNHPGGSLTPSKHDIQVTKKFKEATTLFEIVLYDHLIITSHGYFSFADEGNLANL